MILRNAITFVLFLYALSLTLQHNLHMLQLNVYKNNEQWLWIKKNPRQQWLLYFGTVLGLIRLFVPHIALDILIWLTLVLIILVYRAIHRLNNKKPLHFTARVKRLMATTYLVAVLAIVATYFIGGHEAFTGIFMCIVGVQWFFCMVANVINHPIETAINRYYMNDAKKKIQSMKDLKVIGVTGSFGKTSVKYYLQTLLQSRFNVLMTPGNFNTPLGVTRTIREYLKPSHEIFICEMGARYVGEIKACCDIAKPDYGVITSIGYQHLETFLSMENIQKTKFELADALPKDGMLFLNGDNEFILEKATAYSPKIFYHGETEGEGYFAKDVKLSQFGTEFTVVTPNKEEERFQMKLVGGHNVVNVVGAIAVANTLGISLKDLRVPVRRIQPVEHRMQMKEQGDVTIIDDAYNSNPVGSKAAVETLAMFDGLKILITPGMIELGEKEEECNFNFGTYAADCCDYIFLVGRRITKFIEKGVLSKGFPAEKCLTFDKVEEAIGYAYKLKSEKHKYILLENDLPDNY